MEGKAFTNEESTELLQYIATNMLTKDDVRIIVREEIESLVPPIIERMVPPIIQRIVPPMIESVVQPMLSKAKHEIMDYVDKKDREYRGEFNLALQKEDRKTDAIIETLQDGGVVSAAKAQQLKSLTPFKSLPF